MSKSSMCMKSYGTLNAQQLIFAEKQSVTQQTSLSTTVALDAPVGSIVCHNSQLATGGNASFTFANSYIQPYSLIFNSVQSYTGGVDDFKVKITSVTQGSAVINVMNGLNYGPMNGVLTLGFMIV